MKITKKNIAKLKKKIVNPNKLFKEVAAYYQRKMGVNKILFFLPDKKNDIFIAQYPQRAKYTLMPIYLNGRISCLVLIKGKNNSKTNTLWSKEMEKTIEHYLEVILNYNQALEGIISSQI